MCGRVFLVKHAIEHFNDSDGSNTYTWDSRQRLSTLTGAVSGSFSYDAANRRSQKTISGQTTSYVFDGANLVQELTGTVTPTVQANLLTGGLDEVFSRTEASGSTYSYLADALGSTQALTDSTGAFTTQYTYEPYGQTSSSGSASTNSQQYAGRENDGTGLYYYRARYYSPGFGRFISRDPISLAGGINTYGYVGGNPVSYIDPLGLWRLPDFLAVNINVAIPNPITDTYFGWSETASLDRYGNWYGSVLGAELGKSANIITGSITANWINQSCNPTENQLNNFLSGNGVNTAAGFWGGGGFLRRGHQIMGLQQGLD
ncbi:RHS repeat-associated core domain-containing protein [Pseudomonas sp. LjRoot263]|uniref:RHS repeat-associated core domain-containing protein n=1 Tax=Pseudomonas sp. LjRoot263 TaxID=3342302 RepID=UPI003ECD7860